MNNEEKLKKLAEAGEMLWTVVSNVSHGDWSQQSELWQEAAARWRDNYWNTLEEVGLLNMDEEVELVGS
jgi:hypothetical protein